jgi:hypothetical protein
MKRIELSTAELIELKVRLSAGGVEPEQPPATETIN